MTISVATLTFAATCAAEPFPIEDRQQAIGRIVGDIPQADDERGSPGARVALTLKQLTALVVKSTKSRRQ
jgi:hypothetical protein